MITFFEKDWGFLVGEASMYHFDFLPRFTVVTTPHIMEISMGFTCFRLRLTLWGKAMQEFNRNNRRGGEPRHISDIMKGI